MTTNKNTTGAKSVQDLSNELDGLLDETKKLNQEIEETRKETRKDIDSLDVRVNESVIKLKKIYSDLDNVEEETNNELDKFILEQTKDLAVE